MFQRPVDTSGGSRPSDKQSGGGGGKVPPFCFKPFGPQFGLKLGGGGCCSLGRSPRSATGRNFIRLCSHYGSMGRIVCYTAVFSVGCVADYMANSFSWIEWTPIGYVTFHFRDRCVAAYLRYRNRAEITVFMCEQKPYPVWFPRRRKSSPVECEHSLRMRRKICKSQLSNGKWSALNSCLNCKIKGVFDRLYCCHGNRKWS